MLSSWNILATCSLDVSNKSSVLCLFAIVDVVVEVVVDVDFERIVDVQFDVDDGDV